VLVTFTCKAYADITMFGDVALGMLRMMGHSEMVPGAILAEDVPAALDRLKRAVETAKAAAPHDASEGRGDDSNVFLTPVWDGSDGAAFPLRRLRESM